MPGLPFILLMCVAPIELVCWAFWVPAYFRIGISIFWRHSPLPDGVEELDVSVFERGFTGGLGPPILLRSLGPTEAAVREKMISFSGFNYTPLMHGLVSVDRTTGVLSTRGRLNAFPVFFVWVWISFGVSFDQPRDAGSLVFIFFPLGLLAVIYVLQASRYAKLHDAVLSSLAEAARHEHSPE
jgi:hypothetical protein